MSIGTCWHEENGMRCTKDAVVVTEDGDEFCDLHVPKDAKLAEDFREDETE